MKNNIHSKQIATIITFFFIFMLFNSSSVLSDESTTLFSDKFNDNILDNTKWIKDVQGIQSSYEEINQEAKFTIYGEHAYLISQVIMIQNWEQIIVSGTWKSPGVTTAEMNCYLYDNDTNQRIGVAYDNWFDQIRYWYSNNNSEEKTRLSPQNYASFRLIYNKTSMQYWENNELLHENKSTALTSTTQFQLKIGGWDASSIPNQIIYFDDIIITAIFEENASKQDQQQPENITENNTSFLNSNQTFIHNQIGSRSIIGKILGKQYAIPIATMMSIMVLFLSNILFEFISDYSSEKIINYQKDKKKEKKITKKTSTTDHKFLSQKESSAVIVSALILSFVLSWTWAPRLSMFLEVFVVTLILVY